MSLKSQMRQKSNALRITKDFSLGLAIGALVITAASPEILSQAILTTSSHEAIIDPSNALRAWPLVALVIAFSSMLAFGLTFFRHLRRHCQIVPQIPLGNRDHQKAPYLYRQPESTNN